MERLISIMMDKNGKVTKIGKMLILALSFFSVLGLPVCIDFSFRAIRGSFSTALLVACFFVYGLVVLAFFVLDSELQRRRKNIKNKELKNSAEINDV